MWAQVYDFLLCTFFMITNISSTARDKKLSTAAVLCALDKQSQLNYIPELHIHTFGYVAMWLCVSAGRVRYGGQKKMKYQKSTPTYIEMRAQTKLYALTLTHTRSQTHIISLNCKWMFLFCVKHGNRNHFTNTSHAHKQNAQKIAQKKNAQTKHKHGTSIQSLSEQ